MMNIDDFKEKRLADLRARLDEINEIVGLDSHDDLHKRNDELGMKLREKNLAIMKEFYEEMVSIKKEIAKLEGRLSIFEILDES